jgi:hypothetical protein
VLVKVATVTSVMRVVGPLVTEQHRNNVAGYIDAGHRESARRRRRP